MATELIRGVNHVYSLLDKPIKLIIILKSPWRCSQLKCKTESAKAEAICLIYPTSALSIFVVTVKQENLSSSFLTRSCSKQPAQLQRLVRKLKLERYFAFQLVNNEGSDQTEQAGLHLCCLQT